MSRGLPETIGWLRGLAKAEKAGRSRRQQEEMMRLSCVGQRKGGHARAGLRKEETFLEYTMPLHFHLHLPHLTHLRRALSVPGETAHAAQALRPAVVSGFDLGLFFLLVNGGLCVAWGSALTVFVTGVVPIYWGMSQYGQQHPGLTNIIITGLATLSTTHLTYTRCHFPREFPSRLGAGCSGLQGQKFGRPRAGESFFDHVYYDDLTPCGVDPASMTLTANWTMQSAMDQGAFRVGLQLGNYGDQIAANTTTAVFTRAYLKDNFGYGSVGGLVNALQQVTGVEMHVYCDSTHDSMSLPLLWSETFPNLPLTSLNINETTPFVASVAPDGSHAIVQSSFNSTYPPFNSTSLSFTWTSMFATVNASGSGAIVIADSSGRATGCTWDASPRLVHVEIRNWVSFVSSVDYAFGFPAPAGRAVFSTITGIGQAIRLGASLSPPPDGYPLPPSLGWYPAAVVGLNAARVLETLFADGVKAALTYYTEYCRTYPTPCELAGIALCNSQNRTVQEHWRFGDANHLGILAIMLNLVLGSYA
ncbi:hypothetical protein C8R45DRAFT_923254 [Mycena sanguinolenta]|nr:hypothetical protein C8R45DRAFT_923254 [Mycena sanguinolenta]